MRRLVTLLLATATVSIGLGTSGAAAHADTLPSGCAGAAFYACTGNATAPDGVEEYTLPYNFTVPSQTTPNLALIPSQAIGGVAIVLVPEQNVGVDQQLGGPTPSIELTAVVSPVSVCYYVDCLVAGQPVKVPSVPLPVVPVYVAPQHVSEVALPVPYLTTTPPVGVPGLTTPQVPIATGTLHVVFPRETDITGRPYAETVGEDNYNIAVDGWHRLVQDPLTLLGNTVCPTYEEAYYYDESNNYGRKYYQRCVRVGTPSPATEARIVAANALFAAAGIRFV